MKCVPVGAEVEKPTLFSGTRTGMLADQVPVAIKLDGGADHPPSSAKQLSSCDQAGLYVPLWNLLEPVPIKLAVGVSKEGAAEDSPFIVTSKARLSLTLETPVGPLSFRNVNFLVLDDPMDEILISLPTLRELG